MPSWVASIGPKGYQTDMGYLTRTHPPIIREARDERRPSKPAAGQPGAGAKTLFRAVNPPLSS